MSSEPLVSRAKAPPAKLRNKMGYEMRMFCHHLQKPGSSIVPRARWFLFFWRLTWPRKRILHLAVEQHGYVQERISFQAGIHYHLSPNINITILRRHMQNGLIITLFLVPCLDTIQQSGGQCKCLRLLIWNSAFSLLS